MSTSPGPSAPTVLSLRGISKRFGTVQAVLDVTVECQAGEVHAVVGENGSGKSTLLGVASGVLVPDEGVVEIGGQPMAAGTAVAKSLGLGMAYQTFSEVGELSVAENLHLGTPPSERPEYGEMRSWAAARIGEYGLDIDPRTRMGTLSLSQRQQLEVIKALLSKPKVLLLDEPTTALGPGDVEWLHHIVEQQVATGVGVVYVSHRLPEVLGLAHRVTVLRDGVSQGTFGARGMSEEDLVALMIGRPMQLAFPEREGELDKDEVLLDVSNLQGPRFGPINLKLLKGEILGIAGAEGNGQLQFLRSLAGVERSSGSVRCKGSSVDLKSPPGALKAGIVLLSGERARESVFTVLSVRPNASVQVLRRFSRFGWIVRGRERKAVLGLVRRLSVRTASIEQPVQFLSGGNQQKVALMRPFIRGSVNVILADEPTQGVDVRSRFDIYEALRTKSKEGVAVVVKSSDPIELSGLCDRVIVISRGRIIDEIPAEELGEKRIIEAIVGQKAAAAALAQGEGS